MSTEESITAAPGARLYGLYLLGVGCSLVGNLSIRLGDRGGWLPSWSQAPLAILVTLPLLASVVLFWRLLSRDLDEMLQRIVLEGMAFALVVFVPLAAVWVNLRTAGVPLFRLDPPELILGPSLLVAVGIAIAASRYR